MQLQIPTILVVTDADYYPLPAIEITDLAEATDAHCEQWLESQEAAA